MKKIVISIISLFFAFSIFAQDIPAKPDPPRLVNDFARVLSASQTGQLETELDHFAQTTSTQIAIVTVPSLNGYDVSDYAIRLHEKWGVGQKEKNNGIVVLFKPKTNTERGQVFISVGYGLEGVIPDAIAHRDIVDAEMIPRFKQNDIFGGLYHGTRVLMSLASGEYSAEEYHQAVSGNESGGVFGGIIFFLLIFIVFPVLFGRRRRFYSGGSSLPFWIAMGMMGSGRNSHSGSWSNFSSGSGGFGGFGGFGGGMTGGGGAGGSW
jgi:uncharacterized protein